MKKPGEKDDEEPPGGRAMERLRQFEEARGFEPSEVPDDDFAGGAGESDAPVDDAVDDDEEPNNG